MVKLTRTTPIAFSNEPARKRCLSDTVSSSACSTEEEENHEEVYVMEQSVADGLVERTERKVKAFLDKSQWVRDHNQLSDITRFEEGDFEIGALVAFGGFSNIHLVSDFHKDCDMKREQEADPHKEFVVKHLKPKLALNPHKVKSGARDICNETYLLSALSHKHIIGIRGLSSAGIHGLAETCRTDFVSYRLVLFVEMKALEKLTWPGLDWKTCHCC